MIIEYASTEVFTKQLELADVGNFGIRCSNDDLTDYYMIVKTVMGKTSIFKFGPIMPDMPTMMLDGYSFVYRKTDYKEQMIDREVTTFINDKKKKVTTVEEITEYEALQAVPHLEGVLQALEAE